MNPSDQYDQRECKKVLEELNEEGKRCLESRDTEGMHVEIPPLNFSFRETYQKRLELIKRIDQKRHDCFPEDL